MKSTANWHISTFANARALKSVWIIDQRRIEAALLNTLAITVSARVFSFRTSILTVTWYFMWESPLTARLMFNWSLVMISLWTQALRTVITSKTKSHTRCSSEARNLLNSQLKYLCISRQIWKFSHTLSVSDCRKTSSTRNPLEKYLTHGLRTAEEQMQLAQLRVNELRFIKRDDLMLNKKIKQNFFTSGFGI